MNEDNNNRSPQNGGGDNNNRRRQPFIWMLVFALVAMLITALIYSGGSDSSEEISYTRFLKLVEDDEVRSVTFDGNRINIRLKSNASYQGSTSGQDADQYIEDTTGQSVQREYYTAYIQDDDLLPLLKEHNVTIRGEVSDSSSAIIYNILSFIIPLVILWIVFAIIARRMGGSMGMGVGKSNAKVYVEKSTGVTFKDVAGQDEAKESLQEVVDFLNNPGKYTAIGAKLPKGALLVGPPGTGKTLLAKAVAGEAGVPFFSLAGSDFVEMFVGVGASRVRDLFHEAQKQAPSIIFIDEIDAIGKSRDSRYGGGNDEREQTLNQLLAEMDGFDTSKGLLVLAATNRPEVLDKALLRPGRFDRRIIVDRPDQQGRLDTLKVHSRNVPMDETVDLEAIATASAGLVGSDLANIINEAAICAVKHKRKFVNQSDLFEAFELVAVGGREKKNRAMSDSERRIVSYHEVGHALVAALQKGTEPVQKITIVPRTMGALGYTLQTPEEEKFLETKDELMARIATLMGGRAAECLVFNSPTSGASNDIEQATNIARAMVTRFGMSEKFGMMGLASVENQYLDGRAALTCGEETASQIDGVVLNIITESYNKAYKLLADNRAILDRIADYLYEKETITGKEFMQIFRQMKGEDAIEDDSPKTSGTDAGSSSSNTGTGIGAAESPAAADGGDGSAVNIPADTASSLDAPADQESAADASVSKAETTTDAHPADSAGVPVVDSEDMFAD